MNKGKKLPGQNHQNAHGEIVAHLERPDGNAPFFLLCEHASNYIPPNLNQLGLDGMVLNTHAAYDLGAAPVAREMSKILDAPLMLATNSRLVYDLNRPPTEESAILSDSEIYRIPGNAALNSEMWGARAERYYWPFVKATQKAIGACEQLRYLITIHSFAPTYYGKIRSVELGFLHDHDGEFAAKICTQFQQDHSFMSRLNEPYSAQDGVTHSLKLYGNGFGLQSLMIEIRNDLIQDVSDQKSIAAALSASILKAVEPAKKPETIH